MLAGLRVVGPSAKLEPTMATRRRVRLQNDERRAQLIQLGTRVFSSRPYDDVSIDELAEAAGISKGLLYHYFRGKRELYVETVRTASLHLRRLTEPDASLPPGERLRAAIDGHLDYVRQHGRIYASIYRSGSSVAPQIQVIWAEHREIMMQRLLKNLEISKPRPVLRSALSAWIAMVEGVSLDWLAHPEVKQPALRELLVASYGALVKRAAALEASSAQRPLKRQRVSFRRA